MKQSFNQNLYKWGYQVFFYSSVNPPNTNFDFVDGTLNKDTWYVLAQTRSGSLS